MCFLQDLPFFSSAFLRQNCKHAPAGGGPPAWLGFLNGFLAWFVLLARFFFFLWRGFLGIRNIQPIRRKVMKIVYGLL